MGGAGFEAAVTALADIEIICDVYFTMVRLTHAAFYSSPLCCVFGRRPSLFDASSGACSPRMRPRSRPVRTATLKEQW
jgi:hypothetical protein